jgi:hypothetical protein
MGLLVRTALKMAELSVPPIVFSRSKTHTDFVNPVHKVDTPSTQKPKPG